MPLSEVFVGHSDLQTITDSVSFLSPITFPDGI